MSALSRNAEDEGSKSDTRLTVDPAEWSYLAEGGFHIILRYDGTNPNIMGKILRIGKESLVHTSPQESGNSEANPEVVVDQVDEKQSTSSVTTAVENATRKISSAMNLAHEDVDSSTNSKVQAVSENMESQSVATDQRDGAGVRRRFERGVLIPRLGSQYVQPGDAVELAREDIDKIHKSVDPLRPEGRLEEDPGEWSEHAQLEPDKTAFWLQVPEQSPMGIESSKEGGHGPTVIALEIKPKGAGMPVGALVPPGPNRLKFRVNRFDAQQRFKAQDEQEWGVIDKPTGYHPREFYSGDEIRIGNTLKELLKAPQNKFRAWEHGTLLIGAGAENVVGDAAGVELLSKAVEAARLWNEKGNSEDVLMDMVGDILAKEPLVSRLRETQALDVLEVEGGGLVFDRLVALCGNSKHEALLLLQSKESDPFVEDPVETQESTRDLILPPGVLTSLHKGEPVDGLDAMYEKARAAVDKLDVKDCVQLLRRSIIALGVMDCSVMLSLVALTAPHVPVGEETPGNWIPQGDRTAGVIDCGDGRRVAYCLSVVDAGPKPAKKLPSKAKHEQKIWEFVEQLGLDSFT